MANLSNINGKFVVEQTTGYVGIGTTNPNFLIEAAGTNAELALNASSIYRVRSTSNDEFIITKNGVGDRLVIAGGGNVGINENAPGTLLSLAGDANASIITLKCTKNDSSWTIGDKIGGINFFSEDGSGPGAGIRGSINYISTSTSGGATAMTFNVGDGTEKMRIANGGSVGIGTTSPTQKLEIAGGYLKFSGGDYGIQGSASLTYNPVSDHYFQSNGTEKMRIASTGIVYIMGATPSVNNSLQLSYNSTAGSAEISAKSTGGNTHFEFYTSNSGTTSEKVRIKNDGNVGIGLTNPDSKLYVKDGHIKVEGNATDTVFFEGVKTGTGVTTKIYNNSNGTYWDSYAHSVFRANQLGGSGGSMVFMVPNEVMRITSNGNVGIGVTSPGSKFTVDGVIELDESSGAHGYLNTDGTNFEFDINRNPVTGGFSDSSKGHARMAMRAEDGGAGSRIIFATAAAANTVSTERMRIDKSGNVGVGTTSLAAITGNVSAITIGGTNGSVSGGVMFQFNGNNAASHYYESSNFRYQNVGNYDHTFYTSNTTQRFQINTNGWSYFNNQGTGGGIEINGTGGKYLDVYCNASLAVFSTNATDFYFNTDVGISTTSPTTELTVKGVITAGDSSTDAVIRRQHQTFATMKPGPSSGGSVDMMFVDHTHSLDITVMAYINTSNVATGRGYSVAAYGSATTGLTQTRFAGNVSALSISYVNTGGSENYILRVTCTYSGADAPVISVTANGQSTSKLRQAT